MTTERGGWPSDWAERRAGKGCPMCWTLTGGANPNDHSVFVADLAWSQVRLESRSRLPGYCVVVWNGRHVAEPFELDDDEAAGYWNDVVRVARALDREFKPMKVNLLTLGNWVPHLHTHVVPRYVDDPAPGGPITWADMFSVDPVDPAELKRQAEAIRQQLDA